MILEVDIFDDKSFSYQLLHSILHGNHLLYLFQIYNGFNVSTRIARFFYLKRVIFVDTFIYLSFPASMQPNNGKLRKCIKMLFIKMLFCFSGFTAHVKPIMLCYNLFTTLSTLTIFLSWRTDFL